MKFFKLKQLIEQQNFDEFESELQSSDLIEKDITLLLREAIKTKPKHFEKFFNLLMKNNADINFADTQQRKTNLMIACFDGSVQVVRLLTEHPKIDFRLEDSKKANAAFYAIQCKRKEEGEECLKLILNKQPDLAHKPANNKTLLVVAVERSKVQIVKLLLENKVDPNFVISDTGNTALHEAVKLSKSKQTKHLDEIVKELIEYRANPHIKNKKGDDCFQYAGNYAKELSRIIEGSKTRSDVELQNITNIPAVQEYSNSNSNHHNGSSSRSPVIKLGTFNSEKDKKDAQNRALKIYEQNRHLAEFVYEMSDEEDQDEYYLYEGEVEPFVSAKDSTMISGLTDEMMIFQKECEKNHSQAQQEMRTFLNRIRGIADRLGLEMETYGSFETGLWLSHCDVDILMIPRSELAQEGNMHGRNTNGSNTVLGYLEDIYNSVKKLEASEKVSINRSIRVPMVRFEIKLHGQNKTRKVDITVQDAAHNGHQNSQYVKRQLEYLPQLKSLFFVIKSMTYHYRLNDPKNGGIRTYALIIMILSFLEKVQCKEKCQPLGELLLDFLYFFGFEYQYNYVIDMPQEHQHQEVVHPSLMVLVIWDPLNRNNNLGKHSKAHDLQNMFKAAYISLHSKKDGDALPFLFDTRRIMLF